MNFNKAGLIGFNTKAKNTYYFDSTDTEKGYKDRCKNIPNWRWKDQEIVYKYNSWGHRSKDISNLDKNNFMLTFGCSYTAGIGIREEDIWTSKVSKSLGLDLYNAAIEGTGCDIQAYNTMHWISNTAFPKPKLVVVQWPRQERKTFIQKNNDKFIGYDKVDTNDLDGQWYRKRYIMDEGEMVYANRIWFEYLNAAWKNIGVPVLNFTWEYEHREILMNKNDLWHVRCSKKGSMQARDCQHDGPEWHDETSEKLLGLLASYKI